MAPPPAPVSSSSVYTVTAENGQPPRTLNDVADATTITATLGDRSVEFTGTGSITPNGIRFHETSNEGREIRVWIIMEDPSGTFLADCRTDATPDRLLAPASDPDRHGP